ncbi:hypothetical protein [Flavobacterium sp.]|uniref:hypothetical protein n=1 Tax=Flavobacterium sp. TaxID=239 RepID=UPI003265FD1A
MIWAAVLLVVAAVAFSVSVFDLREYQSSLAAWIVTGLGGVFVVGALIALIARAAARPVVEPELVVEHVETPAKPVVEHVETPAATPKRSTRKRASTSSTSEADQPVD